mmetsp:Transcript_34369/g.76321  ORF Transcript_34369/g.76321 Transcript_34369/m.76321 type:complete len:914 (+) Transcript_34369:313-3054(+)|eukprot:CAMPEP_0202902334 /NCGR_PEP_ID=MMETSP1392-20130828/16791_1 /ASSEMBLY_ACC=CAM_ASM_000868 /TAXON_ID=225041 /ORGANISM="Chlamydomonas chlamydogama, Strain SAG 11-48b" /LENGTH=913 /DNA_ID=CAMNT_0049589083 /DNA_START=292 /DNA_END=3033 /DNA_ORIENTATION=-
MKGARAAVLQIFSLCLLSLGVTAFSLPTLDDAFLLSTQRLGRDLLQTSLAAYLIPTMQPQLCTGPNCCQMTDYTSPYRLQHLNRTTTTSVSGKVYTTFYMNLIGIDYCDSAIDINQCCTANITSIWVDVDPEYKVRYATFNNQPSIIAQQTDLGFQMKLLPTSLATGVPASGVLITVTVEKGATYLCPPSDIAPIPGLCGVIIEGATPQNANACCPRGLSIAENKNSTYIPQPPQCQTDINSTVFSVSLQSVTNPYSTDGGATKQADYTFVLNAGRQCAQGQLNSCCDLAVEYMQFQIVDSAKIRDVHMAGAKVIYDLAPWNQPGYQGLEVNVGLKPSDVPPEGIVIVVTIDVPQSATLVPNLCSNTRTPADQLGPCFFKLIDEEEAGFCCPNGLTSTVEQGLMSPPPSRQPPSPPTQSSPSPPGSQTPPPPLSPPVPPRPPSPPRPPPGVCEPNKEAPLLDTSMGLGYYEGPVPVSATTEFVFMVSNHNSTSCSSVWCQDVCGWQLFVNPAVASSLTFKAEDPANNNNQLVMPGANASVTFKYGPASEGTTLYTIVVPKSVSLADLCRPNALPGQPADKPCAAIVKGIYVYSTVFFSQSDVMVVRSPPPPHPVPVDFCYDGLPLTDSCIQVVNTTYNTPQADQTVLNFTVVNLDGQGGCVPDDDVIMSFQILLEPNVVTELSDTNAVMPSSAVFTNRGITWPWSPVVPMQPVFYMFKVGTGNLDATQTCMQNVLPGQPPNSCVVVFRSSSGGKCYRGWVVATKSSSLTWPGGEEKTNRAGVIAPAVVIPVVVVALVAAAILFAAYRKRKRFNSQDAASDDLAAPLATAGSADLARSSLAVSERAASDIQIRLPSASGASQVASRPASVTGRMPSNSGRLPDASSPVVPSVASPRVPNSASPRMPDASPRSPR